MYALIRAIIDSLLSFISANAGKGVQVDTPDDGVQSNVRIGRRVREYLRNRIGRLPEGGASGSTDGSDKSGTRL